MLIPERFVSAQVAADYLSISRRFLLQRAREGMAGAYAINPEKIRKTWVFKLSELAMVLDPKMYDPLRRSPLK